ncbi:MAG: RIP metalloprotease RseP, partial [Candidatus Tectomicrobia bacterium]|nr:RIP metalloprotease RseP [Candidatus Tectomicrobia bacterium]
AAGMQKGDLVLAIDNTLIENWDDMRILIQASPGKLLHFRISRENQELVLPIEPRLRKTPLGEEIEVGQIGVQWAGDTIIKRYDPLSATFKGVEMTWLFSKITIVGIVKMIQGKISVKNIMGPVGIVQMTGRQAKGGGAGLAHWAAILSLSLGIFNLLPIPILDGGHILFLSIEAVVGKNLSTKIRDQAVKIGFVLLVLLMLLALYNDVERIFLK